jgi:hypothetical protein
MSDEETIADNHTKEEVESSMFKVIAHDSVSQTNLLRKGEQGQGVSFQEAKRLVKEFGEKVDRLEMNVEDELERWETRLKEKAVQWDAIQELWRAGLVVEILLLPFAKLREVRNVLLNQKSGANV